MKTKRAKPVGAGRASAARTSKANTSTRAAKAKRVDDASRGGHGRGGPLPKGSLDTRALNRALLARQMLLARSPSSIGDAVATLVALQAQAVRPPFVGLWSRLENFSARELVALCETGVLVRATTLRATLHIMTASDYARLRAAFRPIADGALRVLGKRTAGLDVDDIVQLARAHFAKNESARFDELRAMLKTARPKLDERAMGYVVRTCLPLVHVPVHGSPWAFTVDAAVRPPAKGAHDGTDTDTDTDTDEALRMLAWRYLGAFGPASVADMQTWSGVPKPLLAATFEKMRDVLVTFRDDKGRELFDQPDAPRPSADVEAPPRLIADFDNIVLGHNDRRRIISDAHRPLIVTKNLLVRATFTVDGFVAGTWSVERKGKSATLTLAAFEGTAKVPKSARMSLADEAEQLVRFVEPDAAQHAVSWT